jgi:glycine/D-amino acid oxidase-like deaminating enzyme
MMPVEGLQRHSTRSVVVGERVSGQSGSNKLGRRNGCHDLLCSRGQGGSAAGSSGQTDRHLLAPWCSGWGKEAP